MAIKQTYTATATWTAAQLADIFRSAFIDAGYMTDWYDSFSNTGIENRILEVIYDGSKTYGKTYYWFKFTTGGVWISMATGWNAGTDQPVGTLNVDYTTTTTNATTGHFQYLGAATSVSTTLVRYTSVDAGAQTWFLLRHATTNLVFTIDKAGTAVRPFLDLNKYYHCGISYVGYSGGSPTTTIYFSSPYMNRRSYVFSALNSGTTSQPALLSVCSHRYIAPRISSSGTSYLNTIAGLGTADFSTTNAPVFSLPIARSNSNPAFTSDSIPITTGMPFHYLTDNLLPADIGIVTHYANNSMTTQDTFVVEAGVNEWEILSVANGSTVGDNPSLAFCARVV